MIQFPVKVLILLCFVYYTPLLLLYDSSQFLFVLIVSRFRAWVTMLRRLRQKNELPKIQIDKLDAVGFEWNSTRKCGSSFMKRYREVLSYLSKVVEAGGDVKELLHDDTEIMKWIDAQRQAYENGKLSESRVQYMDDLPGIDWRNPTSWA